jgi:AraC-like DNA-binding protein
MGRRCLPDSPVASLESSIGPSPAVLASAATGIVTWIERSRGDVDRIFGHSGISPDMAGSPTLPLDLGSFCGLFENAAKFTHNDNFGLWFGNQMQVRDLGLWGYGAISARDVGSALTTLVDLFPYHQQSSSMHLLRDSCGLMRLEYRIDVPSIINRRQDAELTLGNVLNVLREGLGAGWAPEEVHFEHPKPDGWRDHERAFQAPAFFSQRVNAILFRPEIMRRPMPSSDPRLLAAMRSCIMQLWQGQACKTGLASRVKSAVRSRLPDGSPKIEEVAAELRVPVTRIIRELHRDGLNFKTLVEDTRRELALSYLRCNEQSFSDIALLLGYSELSAFSRAVRRWTGESPRELRHRLRCAD